MYSAVADCSISGVAVGSSIGHAIGGFFGGGAAPAPAEAQQTDNAVASQANDAGYQSNSYGRNCEADAKSFASCMTETNGNLQSCTWYLEQLVSFPSMLTRVGIVGLTCVNCRKLANLPPVNTRDKVSELDLEQRLIWAGQRSVRHKCGS